MSDRYEGKPFLRLLECYVLWSIDQLPANQAERLEDMAPRLRATYGADGTWQEVVATQMEFPSDLPASLRGMWERTLVNASNKQEPVDPEAWAQAVVDANFL